MKIRLTNLLQCNKIPLLLDPNDVPTTDDSEKAYLFGTHLSMTFTPHLDLNPSCQHDETVYFYLNKPLPVSLPAKPITSSEITTPIKNLHPKKSPDHDLITNKIIKHLTKKSIFLLTYIFNSMLRISHFPFVWKLSNNYSPKTKQTKTSNFFLSSY